MTCQYDYINEGKKGIALKLFYAVLLASEHNNVKCCVIYVQDIILSLVITFAILICLNL